MTIYLQNKLRRKHRRELAVIDQILRESGTVNIQSIQEKTGWCFTKSENAMRIAHMLNIISPA